MRRRRLGIQKVADELKRRQDNLVWPRMLSNSRGMDVFLWRGSTTPNYVQRVAAWLIGLAFYTLGFVGLGVVWKHRSEVVAVIGYGLMAAGSFFVGIRIFLNGFRRPGPEKGSEGHRAGHR
jgi:hypothetical protein